MATFEFDQKSMPTTAELRRLLQEADENYEPLEELLRLERQLAGMEREQKLTSAEFYRRYQAGEMGDNADLITWAGRYKLYLRLKEAIANSLKVVLTEPSSPTAA